VKGRTRSCMWRALSISSTLCLKFSQHDQSLAARVLISPLSWSCSPEHPSMTRELQVPLVFDANYFGFVYPLTICNKSQPENMQLRAPKQTTKSRRRGNKKEKKLSSSMARSQAGSSMKKRVPTMGDGVTKIPCRLESQQEWSRHSVSVSKNTGSDKSSLPCVCPCCEWSE
jgi:hypothetical protein